MTNNFSLRITHIHTRHRAPKLGEADCFYSNDERLLIIWKNVLAGVV